MPKINFVCPRCNSKFGIDLEDTIECTNCHQEFNKKDLEKISKNKILSTSEKKEFIKAFIDDNNNSL
ncbi:MAG: hypothetical protein P8Y23_02600 [Candidatus Lokiarchaeota archaeon]